MNDNLLYYYQTNTMMEEKFITPEWAKYEQLERSVPQKKLWGLRFGKKKRKTTRLQSLKKVKKVILFYTMPQ